MNTDTKKVKFVYSEAAQKAIAIGRQQHMRFRVAGYGELPTRPFYRGAWWFEHIKEVPESAMERISLLRAAGITFKGFVLAHEVHFVEEAEEEPDFKIKPIVTDAAAVVGSLVTGLLTIASIVLQAVLIDPALIVVLEDGTWLEVMTWYE